jgi:hypothetical protein
MTCEVVSFPGSERGAFLCSRGRRAPRCRSCGAAATRLCDHEVAPGRTCDAPLCARHAFRQGERDLCAPHGAPAVFVPPRTAGASPAARGRSAAAVRITLARQLSLFR